MRSVNLSSSARPRQSAGVSSATPSCTKRDGHPSFLEWPCFVSSAPAGKAESQLFSAPAATHALMTARSAAGIFGLLWGIEPLVKTETSWEVFDFTLAYPFA